MGYLYLLSELVLPMVYNAGSSAKGRAAQAPQVLTGLQLGFCSFLLPVTSSIQRK